MKVLILEDSTYRIEHFRKLLKESQATLHITDNVEDAKNLYKQFKPFDLIFLDHDLDHKIMVNSNKANTGYQFAKFLSKENPKGRIIIHSLNIVGANRMLEEFRGNNIKCEYIPYYLL